MPPRKMKALAATPAPVDTTSTAEKPVLGTMNYARKFREEPAGGYAAPGMPISVKRKKVVASKNSGYLAMYKDGTKGIKASKKGPGGDLEQATPSKMEATRQKPLSPFSQVDDGAPDPNLGPDMPSPTLEESPKISVAHSVAMSLPKDRDAGPKTPRDYKEAAAVIRSDKALYKQYKDGVASGKAFSLSVGGKTFKYAATAKASPAAAAKPDKRFFINQSDTELETGGDIVDRNIKDSILRDRKIASKPALAADELPAVNLPRAATLGQNISIQYGKPKKMKGKRT